MPQEAQGGRELERAVRPTIRQMGAEVARSLADPGGERGEAEALRLALSFVEIFQRTDPSDRRSLVEAEPDPVGDRRFDALLAAVVEYVCARALRPAPAWVAEPERFLEQWWFVSGLRSLHADALVHSPISFARRGVFVTGGALSYA
jgi:hypothetical protein